MSSADVVAREFVHAIAATMPAIHQTALSARLLDGCSPSAGVRRLVLLEEPIARALGNVEVRRRCLPERFAWGRQWYGDRWVDVHARLLHPVLAQRPETGIPLDSAFAREAAALSQALARVVRVERRMPPPLSQSRPQAVVRVASLAGEPERLTQQDALEAHSADEQHGRSPERPHVLRVRSSRHTGLTVLGATGSPTRPQRGRSAPAPDRGTCVR